MYRHKAAFGVTAQPHSTLPRSGLDDERVLAGLYMKGHAHAYKQDHTLQVHRLALLLRALDLVLALPRHQRVLLDVLHEEAQQLLDQRLPLRQRRRLHGVLPEAVRRPACSA